MAELFLDCLGIMALVGEGVTAGMARHARVRLELEGRRLFLGGASRKSQGILL
jgi:hypothetical protein